MLEHTLLAVFISLAPESWSTFVCSVALSTIGNKEVLLGALELPVQVRHVEHQGRSSCDKAASLATLHVIKHETTWSSFIIFVNFWALPFLTICSVRRRKTLSLPARASSQIYHFHPPWPRPLQVDRPAHHQAHRSEDIAKDAAEAADEAVDSDLISSTSSHSPTLYFAYGSNLSTTQMDQRCPTSTLHTSPLAVLKDSGWFIASRGYASIRPAPGKNVYGLLYELDEEAEDLLDMYEGVGFERKGSYYKESVWVDLLPQSTEGRGD